MAGSAGRAPIASGLHVPKEDFPESNERGLVEDVLVQTSGRRWANSLKGRKRWIRSATALRKGLNPCQKDSGEQDKSPSGMTVLTIG